MDQMMSCSVVTDECYRAIGVLTLHFNNLDEQVGAVITVLMGITENFVAESLMERVMFGQKIERLGKLAKKYAGVYGLASADSYKRLGNVLNELKRIGSRRNSLFHGPISFSTQQGRWVVIVDAKNKKPIILQVDEIAKIITDIEVAKQNILDSFRDFWGDVVKNKG